MSSPVRQYLQRIQFAISQYNILDTRPEEIYDDVSELAAEICHSPMAFVSFVDHTKERVYVKSTFAGGPTGFGSEGPVGMREAGTRSFCAECILQDDVFVINNPLEHPYFMHSPFVLGTPDIRYYAGAPLKTPSGVNIGTVCVADTVCRILTEKQLRCLKQLARQVVGHLELRKSIIALETAKRDLLEKNDYLDKLHEEKNRLLGMVSHDIRQPLANIMVSCELMMDNPKEKLPQQAHDLALTIHSSANFMHVLVDDLLQVVKFDFGKLSVDLDVQYWDILKLVKESVVCNSLLAQRKNINLDFILDNDQNNIPITCYVDEHKITQVMNNLISNALKFSYPGSTVQVVVTKRDDSVTIEVKDQGQGIPQSEIHKLFNAFERIRGVIPTGGETSTCLGLVIVKNIVQAHKGTIKVNSECGVGSVFTVSLPLPHGPLRSAISTIRKIQPTSDTTEPVMNSDTPDTQLRILVADDNLVNLRLYRRILEKRGHSVTLCSDGQECLDVLFKLGLDHFDLLIIDEEMPKLYGHEVMQKIRSTEKQNEVTLRILSISGHTSQEHVQKMLVSGANKCFGKPFNVQQLIHLVESRE
jgi:signal transduction histidine kinase/CheY-like chemotaxis protein